MINSILTLNRSAQKNPQLSQRDKERFQRFAFVIDNYRLFGMTDLRIKLSDKLSWLADMADIADLIIEGLKAEGADVKRYDQVIEFFDSVLVN